MKYVFSDVDGVLNNANTKGIRCGFAWIDDENIRVFADFVRWCYNEYGREDVELVLISSWRKANFNGNDSMRSVLDGRLAEKEKIYFDDETESINIWSRGVEVASYLIQHKDVIDGYIVLDDTLWEDYKPLGITAHWVQTADKPRNGRGGLRVKHMKRMKEIIGHKIDKRDLDRMEFVLSERISCQSR